MPAPHLRLGVNVDHVATVRQARGTPYPDVVDAALAVTVVLCVAGIWLVIQIADMRKNQDCYLSGRRNCTPIDVKALER